MTANFEVAHAANILANRPHAHEPWRKMVLVPLWSAQFLFALAACVDATTQCIQGYKVRPSHIAHAAFAYLVPWVMLIEFIMLSHRRLKPLIFIALQTVLVIMWVAILPLSGPPFTGKISHRRPGWFAALYVIAFLLPFCTLVYGIIVYIQFKRALNLSHQTAYLPAPGPEPKATGLTTIPPFYQGEPSCNQDALPVHPSPTKNIGKEGLEVLPIHPALQKDKESLKEVHEVQSASKEVPPYSWA